MRGTKIMQTSAGMFERETPICPRCGGQMHEATVKLGDITLCWPLPAPPIRPDGYTDLSAAEVAEGPFVACPDCQTVSHLSIMNIRGGSEFALTLVRTDADRRFLGEEVEEREI